MKTILILSALLFLLIPGKNSNAQSILPAFENPYFQDSWFGYKSGEYTNGRFPHVADIGDLNNDGLKDIVIGQFALDPGFKVILNNGNGGYSLPVHYPAVKGTECIRIADLNNDGYNDIVLTNSGTFYGFGDAVSWDWGNSISVFLNNGNGTFTAHQEIVTALHPEKLEIIDFDNDSDIDIAVANFGRAGLPGNTVTLLENNGTGTFSIKQNIVVPNYPFRVSAGKINNDNLIDLVVGHESSEKTILINNGDGFNSPVPFGGVRPTGYNLGGNMDLVDIDNDSFDDLVFFDSWGSSTDYINIYKNDGNGNFSNYEEYSYPTFLGSGDQCYYADLNNDGWLDMISASFNGQSGRGFFIFESNGTGGFLPVKIYSSGMGSSAALCDDVNQDGFKDVLIVDYTMSVNVHLNKGDATFAENPFYQIEGSSEDIEAGDINLNGHIDIITSSDDGVATDISVLLNNGDGTFASHYTISRTGVDEGGAHAKLRDMNGNGYPDVLFVSPSNNLSYQAFIAFNNTNGGFNYPLTLPVASCGWGDVDAVDIDNDIDLDIVISEFLACVSVPESGKRLFFLKNNGDGTFQPPYVKVIGSNPHSFTTGDFNQDGNIDLATAHFGPYGYRNFIQIHIGDGTGDFSAPVTKIVGYGPHDIITADFNNDGILDIATGNTGTDGIGVETMSVLLGNSNGTFQDAVTYDAPYSSMLLGVSGMAAADIDHDGDPDILLANQTGGDLAVYINDGFGNFQHLYRVGTGYRPRGIAYKDFTGDGIKDAAVICSPVTSGIAINYVNILEGLEILVSVNNINSNIPEQYELSQNYPNPFNPVTTINFSVPKASFVNLSVYNILGQKVAELVNEFVPVGTHKVSFNASEFSSGVFFYQLKAEGYTNTKKMLLIK
ncbi:MAG: T9SS type A sorting domain-containing protein [Ignavibacteria bacterium]|nr:T9SS type A sorting domain-containing protein [Ignavibacteria bacterium]